MPKGNFGGGRGRGHKGNHKGQRRHFSNPDELKREQEKEEREKQWRRNRGDESSEDEEEKSGSSDSEESEKGEPEASDKKKPAAAATAADAAENLLDVENPNRVVVKTKKVTQLDLDAETKPELSRREREEIEKQKARLHYQKLHAEGKTEEARADLARLAIIRKQREDAAKKREEERLAREAAKQAKTDVTNKALGKGRKT